ncbi:hypothetical protein [Arhodomonas sp. AD133]|uniref:hypothetical protein n=1 Tax=Arhodomonas sp. AD133 TaxID=3415009 RepID=UPI003EBFF801
MKIVNAVHRFGKSTAAKVATGAAVFGASATTALAQSGGNMPDLAGPATNALDSAKDQSGTVATAVVGAVALIVLAGIVISMIRKA